MLCVLIRIDSNEYTQHIIINIKYYYQYKKENHRSYSKYRSVCNYGIFFCYRLKNKFEIAVVNDPSVFEPLKFYCIKDRNGTVLYENNKPRPSLERL